MNHYLPPLLRDLDSRCQEDFALIVWNLDCQVKTETWVYPDERTAQKIHRDLLTYVRFKYCNMEQVKEVVKLEGNKITIPCSLKEKIDEMFNIIELERN